MKMFIRKEQAQDIGKDYTCRWRRRRNHIPESGGLSAKERGIKYSFHRFVQ